MQTPVEIEFQEMVASPAIQEAIEDRWRKLEERYGRITACRIVVKGPGNRHQTGGLYDINIRHGAAGWPRSQYRADTEGRRTTCRTVVRRE